MDADGEADADAGSEGRVGKEGSPPRGHSEIGNVERTRKKARDVDEDGALARPRPLARSLARSPVCK